MGTMHQGLLGQLEELRREQHQIAEAMMKLQQRTGIIDEVMSWNAPGEEAQTGNNGKVFDAMSKLSEELRNAGYSQAGNGHGESLKRPLQEPEPADEDNTRGLIQVAKGVRLLTDLDEIYEAAKALLDEGALEPNSRNYIRATTFKSSLYKAYPESRERFLSEEAYFSAKHKKIVEGWYCDDLIVLQEGSEDARRELWDRVGNYKDVPNYSLKVHVGNPPHHAQMLIVNGRAAHLRIPSRFEYEEAGNCMEIFEHETVRAIEDWFQQLWGRSVMIKDRNKSPDYTVLNQLCGLQDPTDSSENDSPVGDNSRFSSTKTYSMG